MARWLGRFVLVVAGLTAGALAGALRRRPVPPAVQAADAGPGQA